MSREQENKGETNHIELNDADMELIQDQLEDVAVNETIKQADEEFDRELKAIMEEDNGGKKSKKQKSQRKKWSKKRKIITFGILAVVAAGIGFSAMNSGKAPQQMVMTAPLAKGSVVNKLSLSGPVSGTDSVDIVSNLHAEILEIPVKEGDKVTKGQLLATLDSSDIQKEVDMAQNAYELAVSTLAQKETEAQNGYAKAVQDMQAAKGNYDRTNALFQAGSTSQVDLETAQNTYHDAERTLSSYTVKNGKAVADESYELEVKNKAFLLEQKKDDLENTQIISSIDGTVVRVNCKVGRFADKLEDEKPLFIIENLDVLEMKINVSEYSIGSVAMGQKATISADILNGQTIEGEVTAISPTGEEKGGGSTERVIPTTIKIMENNSKLIAGITAKAEIVLEQSDDAWIVPISALVTQADGSSAIATVENNLVKIVPVDIGVESDINMEVIPKDASQFSEQTQYIISPAPGMMDGIAVVAVPSV